MGAIDWRKHLSHDAHAVTQFLKYGIAGQLATAVHISLFFLIGWFLLPCLTPQDPLVRLFGLEAPVLENGLRAGHALEANFGAFMFSNLVAYLLNRWFVFRPGRHHWVLEMSLFYAASAVSLTVGSALMGVLISRWGMATTVAFGVNLFTSIAINYTMRKFVIFHG